MQIHVGSARSSLARPWPRTNGALLPQLQPFVDRALCTVRLLRAHCQHYSAPARVVVVLQEICNLLIEMVEPQHPATAAASGRRRGDTGQGWGAQLG